MIASKRCGPVAQPPYTSMKSRKKLSLTSLYLLTDPLMNPDNSTLSPNEPRTLLNLPFLTFISLG